MRSTMTRLKPCTMGHSRTALDPDVEHQQIICRAIASLDPNTLAAVPDRLSHSDWSGARNQRSHLAELRRLDWSHFVRRPSPRPFIDGNTLRSLVVYPRSFKKIRRRRSGLANKTVPMMFCDAKLGNEATRSRTGNTESKNQRNPQNYGHARANQTRISHDRLVSSTNWTPQEPIQ
jgi:hypothetical protein